MWSNALTPRTAIQTLHMLQSTCHMQNGLIQRHSTIHNIEAVRTEKHLPQLILFYD